jgi:branched-subunit amino acid aminotransferase/4-amino-4-deoxychorismate lyase
VNHVWLNGRLVPEAEAVIPVNDRVVLFGDGGYETVRSYQGKFLRFPQHLERLRRTLDGIGIEMAITDEQILAGADELITADGIPDARVRLTVTSGLHDGVIRLRRSHPPNVIVVASPVTTPSEAAYRDGVTVILSPYTIAHDSPQARLKTVPRLTHLMAKEAALEAGAWDAIFLDEHRNFLEGTMTNLFLVVDGAVCTPPLDNAILEGVTRSLVLEMAENEGLTVREEPLGEAEARRASEAFLTSTTIELLPIRRIGDIGIGPPGPVRAALHRRYRAAIAAELGISLPMPPGA